MGQSSAATNWLEEWDRWTPVSSMKFVAAPPVFQPDKKDGRYHWISKLTLAQLLRRTKPRPGQRYGLPEERIRTTDVNVEWSCEINPRTAEFSNATVDKYIPTLNDSFIEADVRSRLTYGLPIFTGADQTSSQGPEEE